MMVAASGGGCAGWREFGGKGNSKVGSRSKSEVGAVVAGCAKMPVGCWLLVVGDPHLPHQ